MYIHTHIHICRYTYGSMDRYVINDLEANTEIYSCRESKGRNFLILKTKGPFSHLSGSQDHAGAHSTFFHDVLLSLDAVLTHSSRISVAWPELLRTLLVRVQVISFCILSLPTLCELLVRLTLPFLPRKRANLSVSRPCACEDPLAATIGSNMSTRPTLQ